MTTYSFRPEREAFELSFQQFLNDDSVWLAVAELDGNMIGYCLGFDHYTFYANGRVSWVEEIMVKSELRGQGIGRELMESFEAWSLRRSSKLVALATRRAAGFYGKMGYEESAVYFRKLLPTRHAGELGR